MSTPSYYGYRILLNVPYNYSLETCKCPSVQVGNCLARKTVNVFRFSQGHVSQGQYRFRDRRKAFGRASMAGAALSQKTRADFVADAALSLCEQGMPGALESDRTEGPCVRISHDMSTNPQPSTELARS